MTEEVGLTRSEISKRYWDSPEGRRQKKKNAQTSRVSSRKYYKKHGGTHSDEIRAKISRRTKEGIAKATASGKRRTRKRVSPRDGLWDIRVDQVMKEFDLISWEAADSMARQLLEEDMLKFYSKYRGVTTPVLDRVERSLREYTKNEEVIELILGSVQSGFNLPRAIVDKISKTSLSGEHRFPEEVFLYLSDMEMKLWLLERADFEKIFAR